MMRIGFAYNLKDPAHDDTDLHAEFESPDTIEAIRDALSCRGEVVMLPCDAELPGRIADARPDVVFTVAEGEGGRDRESYVTALCGLLGIPCTGSDATALGITMDKPLTKRLARDSGIRTLPWAVYDAPPETGPPFGFPAFVKPALDGTSRGIFADSLVRDIDALRLKARAILDGYGQPVMVEPYLDGHDFCVGILGNSPPSVLPICEVLLGHENGIPFFSFEYKRHDRDRLDFIPEITAEVKREMETASLRLWETLGLRDYSRIDFRTDVEGVPYLLEVNALPGLSPKSGIFVHQAAHAGIGYQAVIDGVLARVAEGNTR
jgi:D-alanine-D-alanine ligase